ncbi:MAG: hypothetical protein VYA30_05760 [Myxococcota bacterium]|nr:hypothetical protein [Myxococcota bacterium]
MSAVIALGACMSCVVPMPIESIGEQVNLPPYYLADYTQPPVDQIIDFYPEDETGIELNSGPIGDPNPNDRIFWRWFLDYRPITSDFPIEFSEANGAAPEQLTGGIRKNLRPCATGTTRLLAEDQVHRVELLVADRPFITSQANDPKPNKTLPENAQYFSLVWFIRFDRAACE